MRSSSGPYFPAFGLNTERDLKLFNFALEGIMQDTKYWFIFVILEKKAVVYVEFI